MQLSAGWPSCLRASFITGQTFVHYFYPQAVVKHRLYYRKSAFSKDYSLPLDRKEIQSFHTCPILAAVPLFWLNEGIGRSPNRIRTQFIMNSVQNHFSIYNLKHEIPDLIACDETKIVCPRNRIPGFEATDFDRHRRSRSHLGFQDVGVCRNNLKSPTQESLSDVKLLSIATS